ncbi:unnamed protein product, partial [Prorocentrum cordatum]
MRMMAALMMVLLFQAKHRSEKKTAKVEMAEDPEEASRLLPRNLPEASPWRALPGGCLRLAARPDLVAKKQKRSKRPRMNKRNSSQKQRTPMSGGDRRVIRPSALTAHLQTAPGPLPLPAPRCCPSHPSPLPGPGRRAGSPPPPPPPLARPGPREPACPPPIAAGLFASLSKPVLAASSACPSAPPSGLAEGRRPPCPAPRPGPLPRSGPRRPAPPRGTTGRGALSLAFWRSSRCKALALPPAASSRAEESSSALSACSFATSAFSFSTLPSPPRSSRAPGPPSDSPLPPSFVLTSRAWLSLMVCRRWLESSNHVSLVGESFST